MINRSELKLGEGKLVETNPEIGRVYPRRKMVEENPLESDSQFMDSFMTMRAMVEEMYREFKKGRGEDSSTFKQDKGVEETLLVFHPEGKGKEEKSSPPSPPSSPSSSSSSHKTSVEKKKKKTAMIKLDVKFDLPIYDGELNAEKLDNWIRQIDVYFRVQNINSERRKI